LGKAGNLMAIGTTVKRNKSLVSLGVMLWLPDTDDSIDKRAAGCEIYYISGTCDDMDFLLDAGFTADPTSGDARLQVKFTDSSTVYDTILEVEESTVDRNIVESPCTTHEIVETPT
jgi:PKD repeat protein